MSNWDRKLRASALPSEHGQIETLIQTVLFSCPNHAEQNYAALLFVSDINEQVILPGDHKGLNAPFRLVVAEFNAPLLQIGC